jgi:hypothetical protein
MENSVPSVIVPAIPYFCNLVVFPAPLSGLDSSFHMLKTSDDVPVDPQETHWLEYIPGSIYCFLPSSHRNKGTVSFFKSRSCFLNKYTYSLEIGKQSIVFLTTGEESENAVADKPWPVKLRGGAGNEEVALIIKHAISNAEAHGINIHRGVENLANDNCAFETVLDSINTRSSFTETFDETPVYWRRIWMTEIQTVAFDRWNNGLTRPQWMAGWEILK